jgi:TonB family protein
MHPILLAILVYSTQVVIVVAAAAAAEALTRIESPGVRLAWWRIVAVACLVMPLFASSATHMVPAASVTFTAPQAGAVAAGGAAATSAAPGFGTALLWLLLTGVLVRLGWLATGLLRLRQLRHDSAVVTTSDDVDTLRLAVAPHAEFRTSTRVAQPATFGVTTPVILLPASFANLEAEEQRAVACHELLHVARGDWRWIVVEELARSVFWFNPAVWWLLDRIESSREQLVDRLVTVRVPAKQAYMRALLAFADRGPAAGPSTAFLRKRHLRSRLRQLGKEPVMSSRRLVFTAVVLVGVLVGAMAGAVRALPLEIPVFAQATPATRLEIRLAERAPAPGLEEVVVPGTGERLYLHPPIVTGENVVSARVVDRAVDNGQSRVVEVTFTAQAASRLRAATQAHVGKPVAIVVNDRVVAAPVLRDAIEGSAVISGISPDEAEALVRSLSPTLKAQAAVSVGEPGVSPPVLITMKKPSYTPQALLRRLQGTVTLRGVVRTDGTVDDVQVITPLDANNFGLDDQAIAALQGATFRPGTRNGQPVNVLVTVQIEFNLRDSPPQ